MNIGKKLYELRKSKNLSQEEVAEKLNVTRQTVSKWETNQSTPDFDKIIPLCELFEISSDELLTGKKKEQSEESHNQNGFSEENNVEENVMTKEQAKIKTAEIVSSSVFGYVLSLVFVIIGIPVLRLNPVLISSLFLVIIGFITARLVKHFMSVPKFEETKKEKKEKKLIKQIEDIIGTIFTIIYFIVSFLTMAWHITWIIFVIYGLVCEVVKLIFMLNDKEEDNDEE